MKKLAFPMLGPTLVFAGLASHANRLDQDRGEPAHTGTYSVSEALTGVHDVGRHVPTAVSDSNEIYNAVVQQYCQRCHGERRQRGNLTLQEFDVASAARDAEVSEKIIRKLLVGMMPPAGVRRPGGDTLVQLARIIERRVDEVARASPNPGWRSFQRLNRAEYRRAIRDLLSVDINAGDYLPLDTKSANFDNIADVQLLSPTLMDAYFRGAADVSRLAIGDANATVSEATYKVSRLTSQREHVEGAPFGTRGGTSVVHQFPADGEYVFKVSFHHETTGALFGNGRGALHTLDSLEQLEISVNGEPVAVLEIDRWMHTSDPNGVNMQTGPIFVAAGPQRISAAFIRRSEGPLQDLISPHGWSLASTSIAGAYGFTSLPHLRDLVISGPYNPVGVSDTPSRARVFSCRPDAADHGTTCAREIIDRIATQAYRRPLEDRDVDALMTFYEAGIKEGGFEVGIRTVLEAILASPHFVFRFEEPPADVRPGQDYRISDVALASRLSFFMWASGPDSTLISLAARGELSDAAVLDEQVRRMLRDPRAEALSTRFGSQWLRLQDLEQIRPDVRLAPDFDQQLKESMLRETELFFDDIIQSDRSVFDLLAADFTFVNERLAKHYGIPNVVGSEFRRVILTDENRRGLLGHGSILTLTSHANRTSPVLRGKWVMEVFLGSPPPPPPPNVPDLEATEAVADGRLLSVRERLEQHRANPACSSCHKMMDPIGLALENFDGTGAFRIKDNGVPIDVVGELYDGTQLSNAADLRNALLNRRDSFARNFIENMLAYALGRRVEYFDMPTVRTIARYAAENDHRMSAIILGIVKSVPFQMSRAEPAVAGESQ